MEKINLKKIGWAAVAGILFGFIAFVLSGSDVSAPFGLLVAYLEYKL
jgi:asparagine N-glycosylation enzyme membrane subunit Stt3